MIAAGRRRDRDHVAQAKKRRTTKGNAGKCEKYGSPGVWYHVLNSLGFNQQKLVRGGRQERAGSHPSHSEFPGFPAVICGTGPPR